MSDTYKIFGGSPYVEGGGFVNNVLNFKSNGENMPKMVVSLLIVAVMVFLFITTFSQKLIGWNRFLVTSLAGLLIAQELLDLADIENNDMYNYGALAAGLGGLLVGWIYRLEA